MPLFLQVYMSQQPAMAQNLGIPTSITGALIYAEKDRIQDMTDPVEISFL